MNWSNSDKFVSIISVNDYVLPCLYGDTLQAVEYHRSVNTSMHCMVTNYMFPAFRNVEQYIGAL